MATYHRFHGSTERIYTPAAQASASLIDPAEWVRPYLDTRGDTTLIHRLRAANLALKGAQNIAPRSVQLAAAHGLTAYSPFFDRALTDWTFSLPPKMLLQGACEKWILKRVSEKYLPPDVVWRDKRGMGVPVTDWCLGPLRGQIRRRLSPRRLGRDGWFNGEVQTLLRGDDSGEPRRRRIGEKIWTLYMLHLWADTRERPAEWRTAHENWERAAL